MSSKILKSKGWKPVKLEGPIVANDLEGLVGIEELSNYKLEELLPSNKKSKKKAKKRKISETQIEETDPDPEQETNETENNEPGAFVRNPKLKLQTKVQKGQKPKKQKHEIGQTAENAENKLKLQTKVQKGQKPKKLKQEIGQTGENENKCSVDDLQAWEIVALPDVLLQGLADLGFTRPTPIQELTLPPAIFGRRDILGAAETGSGKTLAFGLPILTGILKHKEQENENIPKKDTATDDGDQDEDDDGDQDEDDADQDEDEADQDEDDDADLDEDEADQDENDDEQDEEESDFEEREENVEDETINGIGCVRSIDNVQFEERDPNEKYLKPLYALILTPTRELAVQVKNHLMAVAKYTDIKIAVVLGGMASVKQERLLSKCPEIVVATPGRLWELIQEGNPHLSQVDNIRYLAIDETDRMIEKYHFQELHHLLERINLDETKRKQRQTFVFSATLTMVHDLPRYLAKKKKLKQTSKIHKLSSEEKLQNIIDMIGITNPKIVDVTKDNAGTAKSLVECRINCELEEKDFYLYYFLQKHPGRTLIFCNSIGCVKRLANLLTILGCVALPLHATLAQRQRLKNLERFRDNPLGVLVATDVAARGLDIPSVEHVIHYQTPRTSESYVHRSGRTARASKEGITILLIEPNEVNSYVKMCSTLGRTEDLPHFPIMENMLAAVKQRVKLARKLEKLELQTKRTNSETGWLQKAASEMDIILDEDEFNVSDDTEEKAKLKRQINATRQELKRLLAKPIFPKGFSVNYPTSSGQIDIPMVQGDQKVQKAVDVMKNQIQNGVKNKKNNLKKLFKKRPTLETNTNNMQNKNNKNKVNVKRLNKNKNKTKK